MSPLPWLLLVNAIIDGCLAAVCIALWRVERARHLLTWGLGWLGALTAHLGSLLIIPRVDSAPLAILVLAGLVLTLVGWTWGTLQFLGRELPRWLLWVGVGACVWAFAASRVGVPQGVTMGPITTLIGGACLWLSGVLVRSFPQARVTAVLTAIPFGLIGLICAAIPFSLGAGTGLPRPEFYVGSIVGVMLLGFGLLLLHYTKVHEALTIAVRRELEERGRSARLIAETPTGVIVIDEEGVVASFNPAATRICRLEADDALGAAFDDLAARVGEELAIAVRRSLGGGGPQRVRMGEAESDQAEVMVHAWTLGDRGERVVTLQDITRERRLEEELRHRQRLEDVGQLAGGVAHDFNNLLVAITGYAELLRSDLEDPTHLEDVAEILRATNRAAGLVQQLLAFSRKQFLQPRLIDLRSAVDGVATLLRRLIGERIELVTEHPTDPVLAKVDPVQFEQVVMCLATNARAAMPDGGRLRLSTDSITLDEGAAVEFPELDPGRYARVTVSDTGEGMSADVLERAFEPFFTTKPVGVGTGLGLSTVLGIIKQSGGDVHAESQPGAGTTFRVLLPAAEGQPERAQHRVPELGPSGEGTVLIAEDESAVADLVATLLQRHGFRAMSGNDGQSALDVFAREGAPKLDLLITDVVMPRMDGRDLARELAGRQPQLKVLFMSGYPRQEDFDLPPGSAYLAKPFTAEVLLDTVRNLIGPPPS